MYLKLNEPLALQTRERGRHGKVGVSTPAPRKSRIKEAWAV